MTTIVMQCESNADQSPAVGQASTVISLRQVDAPDTSNAAVFVAGSGNMARLNITGASATVKADLVAGRKYQVQITEIA